VLLAHFRRCTSLNFSNYALPISFRRSITGIFYFLLFNGKVLMKNYTIPSYDGFIAHRVYLSKSIIMQSQLLSTHTKRELGAANRQRRRFASL
jgi:hypothetical protein